MNLATSRDAIKPTTMTLVDTDFMTTVERAEKITTLNYGLFTALDLSYSSK